RIAGSDASLHRHVQILADQHALAAQVQVGHSKNGHSSASRNKSMEIQPEISPAVPAGRRSSASSARHCCLLHVGIQGSPWIPTFSEQTYLEMTRAISRILHE